MFFEKVFRVVICIRLLFILINSTLFNQQGILQAVFVAKTTNFVGKMSFSASTKNLKTSKKLIFGLKWHFSPKNLMFTFLLKTVFLYL